MAKNVTCGFILSDLPQQGPELFGQHTALIDEFRSRINLGKEAAFNTVRIADVLQRQQLVKVYKLAALCARQAPCMAYSFTEQENATTGRWATKPVRSQSQSGPMIPEKSADESELGARLLCGKGSVESHRFHPEKCCAKRQLKKSVFLLSKGSRARRAVAAALSIGLAFVDVCFGSASPEFPDLRGLKRGPAQDLEIR
ncbi:hypothetical protein [Sedimentitalea nanhaiensis]|uniref:hypothetical protein n=1 Tax=Sedimentitalea nanhaiensis TaxID=999627 RepID=UPI00111444B6|nr:hypothetical protein [Sedimentitalea nanhaiensis]